MVGFRTNVAAALQPIAEAFETLAGIDPPTIETNTNSAGFTYRIQRAAALMPAAGGGEGGGAGGGTWGSITGTLSAQTDLQTALDLKLNSANLPAAPDLSSYATTAALTSGLAAKQASGDYATTAALTAGLATKQASGNYLVAADLAPYATTASLSAYQPAGSYQPLAAVLTATTASFTTAKDTKLSGIATSATANDTDANLKARGNHTGTQLASTISDFSTAADARVTAGLAGYITSAAAAAAYQPLDTDLTAIAALTTTAYGRSFLPLADAAAARTLLGLGTAAQSASGDFQPLDADLTAIAALTTTSFGRSRLVLADAAALTAEINPFTSALKGAVPASAGGTTNYLRADGAWGVPPGSGSLELAPVKYDAAGSAIPAAIADYFTSTISLEASSTYEIACRAYLLKTTAGTIIWTWTFSSAPIFAQSFWQAGPITGFTTAIVNGTPLFGHAVQEASLTLAHAASGSLTTAVRHSFMLDAVVRTNAATTIQLRSTQSAGTLTPQPGSYMRARKIA